MCIPSAHVHNVRNFPQVKLDSERNARFLLNKNSELYMYNFGLQIILFELKIKKNIEVLAKRLHKTVTRGFKLWSPATAKCNVS